VLAGSIKVDRVDRVSGVGGWPGLDRSDRWTGWTVGRWTLDGLDVGRVGRSMGLDGSDKLTDQTSCMGWGWLSWLAGGFSTQVGVVELTNRTGGQIGTLCSFNPLI